MELEILQTLQRAGYDEKQNLIQQQGFDLLNTVTKDGVSIRRYYKCWETTLHDGTTLYQQVLLWDVDANTLVFATSDEADFQQLRQAIEARHGNAGGNLDFYAGKMFFYRFDRQQIDNRPYASVTISLRN